MENIQWKKWLLIFHIRVFENRYWFVLILTNRPTDRNYQFDVPLDDWGGWVFIWEKIICQYISSDISNISIYFSRYIRHIDLLFSAIYGYVSFDLPSLLRIKNIIKLRFYTIFLHNPRPNPSIIVTRPQIVDACGIPTTRNPFFIKTHSQLPEDSLQFENMYRLKISSNLETPKNYERGLENVPDVEEYPI